MSVLGGGNETVQRRSGFGQNPEVGRRGRMTQERILAAAIEAFGEFGFADTQVEQITQRANCSRPTFYQYFPSKEALFERLAGRLGASLTALTASVPDIEPTTAARDRLRPWVADLVALHRRQAPIFAAFRPALRGDPKMMAAASELTLGHGLALTRAVRPRPLHPADAEVLGALVMTMLTSTLSFLDSALVEVDDEGTVDQLTDVLWFGLTDLGGTPPITAKFPTPRRSVDRTSRPQPGARQQLIDAAAVVFPALGWQNTRVDDLVAQAGVAHGTFYRYFDDKGDLFALVAERAAERMLTQLEDLPAALETESVAPWAERWITSFLADGALFSVWFETARAEEISQRIASEALGHIGRVTGADGRQRPVLALALLALLEWAPYLVANFPGFDERRTRGAMTLLLARFSAHLTGGTDQR